VNGSLSGPLDPTLPGSYSVVLTAPGFVGLFSQADGTGNGTFSLLGDISATCSGLFAGCSDSATASGVFGGTLTVTYDYLDAVTAVPEPATLVLLATGLVAFARDRRAQRRPV